MLQVFAVFHVLISMALVGPDPDALRPRRRHRRHGLHAAVAGRHAHRRAEPDARDDGASRRSSRSTPSCCSAGSAVALALAGCSSHDRICVRRLPVARAAARAAGRARRGALAAAEAAADARRAPARGRRSRAFHVVRARPGRGLVAPRAAAHRLPPSSSRIARPCSFAAAGSTRRRCRSATSAPRSTDGTVGDAVHVTNLCAVDGLVPTAPCRVRCATRSRDGRAPDYAVARSGRPRRRDARRVPARVFRAARRRRPRLCRPQPCESRSRAIRRCAYGAWLLAASWRDLGLDVHVVRHRTRTRPSSRGIAPPGRSRSRGRWTLGLVSPRVRGWRENAQRHRRLRARDGALDARRRAAARDVEMRGRDRRHEGAERVALAVALALVHERHASRVSAGTSASMSGTATVKRRLTSGSAILPSRMRNVPSRVMPVTTPSRGSTMPR